VRQGLGTGVGRGEDGVGTGVMWGGGMGRGDAVGRGDGGGGTGVRWGAEVGRGLGVGRDLGVGLTLPPCALTITQPENSEVLLFGSVAVAVTTCPDCRVTDKVTLIIPLQLASVGMLAEPMKVCPSPLPSESHSVLSKNSTRKVVLSALFKLP
jgi:hypothetical protein